MCPTGFNSAIPMAAIIATGVGGSNMELAPSVGVLASNPWRHVIRSPTRPDRPGAQDLDAACPRGPRPFHGAPVLEVGRGFFHPVAIPPPCPARGGTALWGSVAYARPGKRLGRSFLGHREGGVGRFRAGESGE